MNVISKTLGIKSSQTDCHAVKINQSISCLEKLQFIYIYICVCV